MKSSISRRPGRLDNCVDCSLFSLRNSMATMVRFLTGFKSRTSYRPHCDTTSKVRVLHQCCGLTSLFACLDDTSESLSVFILDQLTDCYQLTVPHYVTHRNKRYQLVCAMVVFAMFFATTNSCHSFETQPSSFTLWTQPTTNI